MGDIVKIATQEPVKIGLMPFGARIIVRQIENEKVEKIGALYIPENQQEHPAHEGTVLAIGSEVTWVKPGDYVYWGKFAGATLRPKGQSFDNIFVMNEEDLLCGNKEVK